MNRFIVIVGGNNGHACGTYRAFGIFRSFRAAERAAESVPQSVEGIRVNSFVVPIEGKDDLP